MSFKLGLILAFSSLLISNSVAAKQVEPTFKSYLAPEAGKSRPAAKASDHFECSDTIYAVVEVTAPERQQASKHLLIVNWFNPSDSLQERTRVEFHSYGKGTRVWAWLRLSGSTGAAVGQMFDPSFGMSEFIGKWHAEFMIDDKKIATHHFDVLC